MPTRSETDRQLQELYDQVPPMKDCKGRCWVSCSQIDMSDRERQRIRAAGYRITPRREADQQAKRNGAFWCDALGPDGLCRVYELRPMICRLWGTYKTLRCPYGCQPEWWLTDLEALRLTVQAEAIGQGHWGPGHVHEFDEMIADPFRLRKFLQMTQEVAAEERARVVRYSGELPPVVRDRAIMEKAAGFVRRAPRKGQSKKEGE